MEWYGLAEAARVSPVPVHNVGIVALRAPVPRYKIGVQANQLLAVEILNSWYQVQLSKDCSLPIAFMANFVAL